MFSIFIFIFKKKLIKFVLNDVVQKRELYPYSE